MLKKPITIATVSLVLQISKKYFKKWIFNKKFCFLQQKTQFQWDYCTQNRWVYRTDNKWTRYLPRRNDGIKEFDYEENGASLRHYTQNIKEEARPKQASKLWMAWLYRDLAGEPKWTRKHVENLFGADFKVGRMEVFRNTELTNSELWKVKHLIELRPVEFKNGVEPTEEDVFSTRLMPNGHVEVMESGGGVTSENELKLMEDGKQFTRKELGRTLNKKYHSYQSVFEQNVWTPDHITVVK
uniref:39S ribosomal protein L30, mitochondrial n=1 Tax=Caenorhabditis tropicalis TaxID=1561998 RepID=A0A1I7UMC6_9PELO